MSASSSAQRSHVPAWVPQAQGRITYDVLYDYPEERGLPSRSETVPVRNAAEARIVARKKRQAGMCNVRVVPR